MIQDRLEMRKPYRFRDLIFLLLIGLIVGVAFFCFSPYRTPDPHRDSGIFLNIGAEILRGKILYLDTWDNKQPLLYFLNALGLWLGQGSVWGVWGLELAFLLATVWLGYRLLRGMLGPFGSFVGGVVSFLTIFPFLGGNYSEEYALFFQLALLAVLGLVYMPAQQPRSRLLAGFGIGCLAGLSFLIKQTYLDGAAAALAVMALAAWLQRDRRIVGYLGAVLAGFICANLPFWLYFLGHGAFQDYLVDAFLINRYYADLGLLEWVNSFLEKIEFLTGNPVLMLAGAIWLVCSIQVLRRLRPLFARLLNLPLARWLALAVGLTAWGLLALAQVMGSSAGMGLLEWGAAGVGTAGCAAALLLFLRRSALTPALMAQDWRALAGLDLAYPGPGLLLALGWVDLPVMILSITVSGKDFTHYYISYFPAVLLLFGGALAFLDPLAPSVNRRGLLNAALAAILLLSAFEPALSINTFLRNPGKGDQRYQAARYLASVTTPDEPILVWGWEAGIYFMAGREAPTRYAFQFPAYLESPYRQAVLTTLLGDLQRTPPAYIADTLDGDMPLLEGRSGAGCLDASQAEQPTLREIIGFVCTHYTFERNFENIYVYKYNPPGP